MSNLWRHERAEDAAAFGTFAIERVDAPFTPWSWQQEEAGAEPDPEPPQDVIATDEEAVALQTDAFAQGFEAGRRTVEMEVAAERSAVASLAETLSTLRPEPTSGLAALLATTVERLVRQIVGRSEVDQDLLAERARIAAAMIGEESEPARLRLHPDDVPILERARIPVVLTADDSLERGTILLETGQGWIEDSPALRLERLREALDQLDMPL